MEYIVAIISKNETLQITLESIKILSNFHFKTFEKPNDLPNNIHLVILDNVADASSINFPIVINISSNKEADLKKPFHVYDLIKKIQQKSPNTNLDLGDVIFDPLKRKIYDKKNNNISVNLTEKEALILQNLFDNAPKSISKNKLLQKVWKYSNDTETTTIDTHIYKLRGKLSKITSNNVLIAKNEAYKLDLY